MKALLLAAALASTTPAPAPTTHIPIAKITAPTEQQREATGQLCLAIATGRVSFQEVIDKLHIDSPVKQQGIVTSCSMYLQGVTDGMTYQSMQKQNESDDAPDGSSGPPGPENYKA